MTNEFNSGPHSPQEALEGEAIQRSKVKSEADKFPVKNEAHIQMKPLIDDAFNNTTKNDCLLDRSESNCTGYNLNNNIDTDDTIEVKISEKENNCNNSITKNNSVKNVNEPLIQVTLKENGDFQKDIFKKTQKKRPAKRESHPKKTKFKGFDNKMKKSYIKKDKSTCIDNKDFTAKKIPIPEQQGTSIIETKTSKLPSALVEQIDYKLLEGKKGVELLTAIELQTNVNLAKMEFYLSSSDYCSSEKDSPRKAQRTRSVESAVWDLTDKPERKQRCGIKRPRSVDYDPEDIKMPKLDLKSYSKATKSEHSHKRDLHNEKCSRNERSDKSDTHLYRNERTSHSDRKRSRKSSVGVQAHANKDYHKHYLKIMEPRPLIYVGGNFTYPSNDVSLIDKFSCLLYIDD